MIPIVQMPEPTHSYHQLQPLVLLNDAFEEVLLDEEQNPIQDRSLFLLRKARREYFWNFCICERCIEISKKELEIIFMGETLNNNQDWEDYIQEVRKKGRCQCAPCRELCIKISDNNMSECTCKDCIARDNEFLANEK